MMFAVTLTVAGAMLVSGPSSQETTTTEDAPIVTDAAAPVEAAAPQDDDGPALEIEVRELFRSTGDEAAFWAAYSRSAFSRVPEVTGLVEFQFDLKEIATVLGSESETQFMVESGADRLTVTQDSQTQLMRVGTQSAITNYVNARVSTLEPWASSHAQTMTPFDATVIPGITAGELELSCNSEPLIVDERTFTLASYRATEHAFSIGDAQAVMSYRGLAILEPRTGVVYHAVFEQNGTVVNGEKTSQINHQVVLTLLDAAQGGEIALQLPRKTQDRVNSFRFSPRTDEDPLDPTLRTNEVRPEWSVDLWLSGRVAEMTMGMIAEKGTNPLPVSALGGLVLSDQAISYGGTQLVQQRKILMGEDDPNAPQIDRVQSPLEKAYGPAPFGERLSILGPETTGVLQIEDEDPVAIGALFLLSRQVFSAGGQASRLAFATSGDAAAGAPVWDTVATEAGTSASSLIPLGILLIGGGLIASSDDGGGGGVTPPGEETSAALTLNQTFVTGCNSGQFELRIIDGEPGRLWRLEGNGTISGSSTCNASGAWSEVDEGNSIQGQQLLIQIPTPPHGCINGTVTITADGVPQPFVFLGQEISAGSFSNNCF